MVLLKSASKIINDTLSTLSLGLGKQMIKLASAEMTKSKVHVYSLSARGPAFTCLESSFNLFPLFVHIILKSWDFVPIGRDKCCLATYNPILRHGKYSIYAKFL